MGGKYCHIRDITRSATNDTIYIYNIMYMPLGSSVEYTIHLTKNFDFRIRREHQKKSYEHRAYESVDVRSLFWVIPHRFSETSTPGLKGLLYYNIILYIFKLGIADSILFYYLMILLLLLYHRLDDYTTSNLHQVSDIIIIKFQL